MNTHQLQLYVQMAHENGGVVLARLAACPRGVYRIMLGREQYPEAIVSASH
jgi:hypothetical protein